MIKVVGLLKRKPGMSTEDFRQYYETHHARLGEKYLGGLACKYVRRYLNPAPGSHSMTDFDVVLEVWYPSEVEQQAATERLADPTVAAIIAADEAQLFDRPNNRFYTVLEVESNLGGTQD